MKNGVHRVEIGVLCRLRGSRQAISLPLLPSGIAYWTSSPAAIRGRFARKKPAYALILRPCRIIRHPVGFGHRWPVEPPGCQRIGFRKGISPCIIHIERAIVSDSANRVSARECELPAAARYLPESALGDEGSTFGRSTNPSISIIPLLSGSRSAFASGLFANGPCFTPGLMRDAAVQSAYESVAPERPSTSHSIFVRCDNGIFIRRIAAAGLGRADTPM